MKFLQEPISDKHKNAMFFDGVIAEHNNYTLQMLEIEYDDAIREFINFINNQ